MAYISDIPDHLLQSDQKAKFIEWLIELPITINLKCQLAHGWQIETGSDWTTDDWQALSKLPPSGETPPGT